MRELETQAEREGVDITFKSLLAEATFAGNAFTYVGGVTPYNALYGRQSAMLPDITYPGDVPQLLDCSRVRELALQSMVQAAALTRTELSEPAPRSLELAATL